jgi:two-component system chemotaxis response regulator CheY
LARILVCDDSMLMRMLIKNALTENGHEVVAEAANGKQAVELYKKHKPQITTMDVTMPEMDGLEAVRLIHEEDCLARIIMVTAIGQKGIVTQALRDGASDFIVKPFEPEEFIRVVNKALKRERE